MTHRYSAIDGLGRGSLPFRYHSFCHVQDLLCLMSAHAFHGGLSRDVGTTPPPPTPALLSLSSLGEIHHTVCLYWCLENCEEGRSLLLIQTRGT